jgi:hypothetical protein
VETERLNPSQQDGWARTKSRSKTLTRHVDPLVLTSELNGLANLSGFVKIGGLVTLLRFPYVPREPHAPSFVPRPIKHPAAVLPFAQAEP